MNHKENKDRILDILNENRGDRHPTVHRLRKDLDGDLNRDQIQAYLDELVAEGLIKSKIGKSYSHKMPIIGKPGKTQTIRGKEDNSYFIADNGIDYIANGYKKVKPRSEVLEAINFTNGLLEKMLENSTITVQEQQKQSELLSQLKEALYDQDDSKARIILKEALDVGKQVAIPLLLEYIKGFARG